MSTIHEAALKAPKDRTASDAFKIKAGHMLTFDMLSQQGETTERQVVRKVIRKNMNRFTGCIALPMTLAYFFFYAFSARLHEDITQVFFMESEFRLRLDDSLGEIETIPDLWDKFIEGDFLNLFFTNEDELGAPRTKIGQKGDRWGNWGRVLTYNQIQGVVRFEQSRESSSKFGLPYKGKWSRELQVLNATDEGFLRTSEAPLVDSDTVVLPPCPSPLSSGPCASVAASKGRRLKDVPEDVKHGEDFDKSRESHATDRKSDSRRDRRLATMTATMASSLPHKNPVKGDRFRFFLYPQEDLAVQKERLKWFRSKQWLDTTTDHMDIMVYLLNCDMGRPRLVEIKIQMAFSRAGGIFYKVDFQTIMLKMFPNMASMMADFIWLCLLSVASWLYLQKIWRSFVKNKFLDYFITIPVIWEAFVLMAGWICVFGFYKQLNLIVDMNVRMENLRELSWRSTTFQYLTRSLSLFEVATDVSFQLGYIRFLMAQYLLFLMFRFLVSFAVQPRLATVTQTLKAVLPDLVHFFIVFFPCFLAYAISGNLIFGRRMEVFATVQGAFATCFRIIMECEYDWDTLAAEYYWTTALWIWSYIVLMNLILLNMVLAIILDVYNDVRQASLSGEMAWTTVYNYWLRVKQLNIWVPDSTLEDHLREEMKLPMVCRDDFSRYFPDMPAAQMDLMFSECAVDMGWEANKFLDKATSLKMSGSVKIATDEVNELVAAVTTDADPMKSFTKVKPPTRVQAKKRLQSQGLFLDAPANLKGNRNPHICDPTYVPTTIAGVDDVSPDWLKNVSSMMLRQKKWILYVNWQVQNLQWQLQQSHFRKVGGRKIENAL